MMVIKTILVTVLRGFPKAQKTTLLNHILYNKDVLKVASFVNDMSQANANAERSNNENTISRIE